MHRRYSTHPRLSILARRSPMSRVQLALNVRDLESAVAFYSKLFATEPAKLRPGYANFAIADPPLKLVLIERSEAEPWSLNHLGVEMASAGEVARANERLKAAGLSTSAEDEVACCFALQDKLWVDGPGGHPWEIYTVLADLELPDGELGGDGVRSSCCPAVRSEPSATSCC